ncbi:trypsin-like serine protease [Vibrio amylolyticus]|uniref:trypsin-like serine protease n=1 Tax=Vibrio amylolyticus TaxID=2847292 RepID=UPI00354F0316
MNKNRIFLSGLLLGCASISFNALASDISTFIVNGSEVSSSELSSTYPNFASLYFDNGSVYGNRCGATIINSEYILTAAHCFYENNNVMLHSYVAPKVRTSTDYVNGVVEKARVEKYYYPDDYSDSDIDGYPNDIAILKLETPLNVSDYSYLINTGVNDTYSLNMGSNNFIAIGHGYTQNDSSKNPETVDTSLLLKTSLTIEPSSVCGSTDKQLCFDGARGAEYKNSTCNGDSGGPIYWWDGAKYVQIGLTSYGPATCGNSLASYTSVFTEVYDYQSWISSVTSGLETPKYYVQTSNGVRTLIRNSDSSVVGTDGTAASTSGSSGGAFGWLTLFVMPFLFGARRKFT